MGLLGDLDEVQLLQTFWVFFLSIVSCSIWNLLTSSKVTGLNMKSILCTVAYWRVLSNAWHQMLWKMLLHKFTDLLEGWHDHMWPCWQAVSELLVCCQSTTWHFSYLLLLCHLACFAFYPWKRISHTLPLHTATK